MQGSKPQLRSNCATPASCLTRASVRRSSRTVSTSAGLPFTAPCSGTRLRHARDLWGWLWQSHNAALGVGAALLCRDCGAQHLRSVGANPSVGGKGSRLGVALKQRKRGDAILCLRHFRRYMLVSPSSAMLQFTTWMVGAPLIGTPRTLL